MTVLRGRRVYLNVNGFEVVDLDVSFRIERSLTKQQNSAEITVYNLAQDLRRAIQSVPGGAVVELRAGYADQDPLPRLFLGQLRTVKTTRDAADWVTTLTSGDSDQAKKTAVSFSLGPGSDFREAVRRVVATLGEPGNLETALRTAPARQLPAGVAVRGKGDTELASMLAQLNLEHSWQDGVLQVLPAGGALPNVAVLLTESTGMVGSPEQGDAQTVKVRSLLNSELRPGRLVQIVAANLEGTYVISRAVYTGDTAGQEWYADVEGKVRK